MRDAHRRETFSASQPRQPRFLKGRLTTAHQLLNGRIELREDENAPDIRMQAIADRDVDEAILSADGHRRLRPKLRERKQPRALAASKDDGQHLVVDRHPHTLQLIPLPTF